MTETIRALLESRLRESKSISLAEIHHHLTEIYPLASISLSTLSRALHGLAMVYDKKNSSKKK